MKRIICVVLLLILSPTLYAATYYVSTVGLDSNSGTSTETAWQTISHVNAHMFNPGDSILFQRGGSWREMLTPPSSGTMGNPITFSTYGSGAAPIINGSDVIPSWTQASNVWTATVLVKANMVWKDGVSLGSPATSKATLSAQDQWFSDATSLSIYSTTNPSTGHTVEAGDRVNAALLSIVNYVTLDGLELKNTNGAAVYLRQDTNDTLQNMKIHDTFSHGVYIGISGGGHTVQNSEIYNTGVINPTLGNGNGIQTEQFTLTIPCLFQYNFIHDIGNATATGDHAIYDQNTGDVVRYNNLKNDPGGTTMKVDADGIQIYGNLFDTAPQGGIYIDSYSNVKVWNNTFYDVGTISPFCAVCFTGNGSQTGVSVENNIAYADPGVSFTNFIDVEVNSTGFTSNHNDIHTTNVNPGVWSNGTNYFNLSTWTSATGQDVNSISNDPDFVNAVDSNFTLTEASAARQKGIPVGLPYTYAQPDLGAVPYYINGANMFTF